MIKLSPNSIAKYRTCGALYFFDIVEKHESAWAWRPKLGIVFHKGIELAAKRKIEGRGMTAEDRQALDAMVREHSADVIENEIDWTLEKEAAKVKKAFPEYATKLVDSYLEHVLPTLPILDVERRFRLTFRGTDVELTGVVDQWLIAGIGDAKSTSKTPSKVDGDHRLQLGLYVHPRRAFGDVIAPSARLDYMVLSHTAKDGVSIKPVQVKIPPSQLAIDAAIALDALHFTADRVRAGDFRRNLAACDDVWGRPCAHKARCQPWRASTAERKGEPGPLPHDAAELPKPEVELTSVESPTLTRISLPIFGFEQKKYPKKQKPAAEPVKEGGSDE